MRPADYIYFKPLAGFLFWFLSYRNEKTASDEDLEDLVGWRSRLEG
jgi:hypothetical protein